MAGLFSMKRQEFTMEQILLDKTRWGWWQSAVFYQIYLKSFKDTTGKSGMMYAYTVRGVAADGETLSAKYNTFGLRVTMP